MKIENIKFKAKRLDGKGNEIREGDLLTFRYSKEVGEVVWREDLACFEIADTRNKEKSNLLGYSIRNIMWYVIGNKFDKEK